MNQDRIDVAGNSIGCAIKKLLASYDPRDSYTLRDITARNCW